MTGPARDAVRVSLAAGPQDLWARRAEWQALVERNATHTVFQTLEWHCSWWRAFGEAARSLLLVAEAGGRLVGIAPLMVSQHRLLGRKLRVVEFIGTHAADYCDFIVDPDWPEAMPLLVDALCPRAHEWDMIELINLAETSTLPAHLPGALRRRGYAAEAARLYECPTRVFRDRAQDEQLLRKRYLRGRHARLQREGRVRFEVYTQAAEIEARLDAFFAQHIARWAGTPTPSFFHDARQREFYRQKARLLGPKGWAMLSVLSLDDAPIAFHFGFEYGGRVYVIKPTFDPAHRERAPGMVQIKHLLEYAMARNAAELDFTVGEERFKYHFANHVRVNYAVRAHPRWMFYGVDRLLAFGRRVTRRGGSARRVAKRLLAPLLGETLHRLGR